MFGVGANALSQEAENAAVHTYGGRTDVGKKQQRKNEENFLIHGNKEELRSEGAIF